MNVGAGIKQSITNDCAQLAVLSCNSQISVCVHYITRTKSKHDPKASTGSGSLNRLRAECAGGRESLPERGQHAVIEVPSSC